MFQLPGLGSHGCVKRLFLASLALDQRPHAGEEYCDVELFCLTEAFIPVSQGIPADKSDGIDERIRSAIDENAGLSIDDRLEVAALFDGDDGLSAGHRLDGVHAERLVPGGCYQSPTVSVIFDQLLLGYVAEERNVSRQLFCDTAGI